MSLFNKIWKRFLGSTTPGLALVTGTVQLGASGAITVASTSVDGATIVKTAAKTGRYTLALEGGATAIAFRGGWANIVGPDDAALTTTKGLIPIFRDDDLATDGTIELQWVQTNAGNADTEIQDNARFVFGFWVKLRNA